MCRLFFLLLVSASTFSVGCKESACSNAASVSDTPSGIAVSNSYIEAAVLDVLNGQAVIQRLAEPGMCPGHFDIRPSQVERLRKCRILMRFDFQKSLDSQFGGVARDGLEISEILVPGGLCEPASFIAACRRVADVLVSSNLAERTVVDERLAAIEARVEKQAAWCQDQMARAGWSGSAVVCSAHQEAFCRWLGLKVVATFSGADSASIGDIDMAVRAGDSAGVRAVIANLPEGRRMADALGHRLNARVVVFGNFPMIPGQGAPFDELLASNVNALVGNRQD